MCLSEIAACVSIIGAIVSIWKAKQASDDAKELNSKISEIKDIKKIENRSNIMCNVEIIGKMVCFTIKNIGKVDAKDIRVSCKNEDDMDSYNQRMKILMSKAIELKPGEKVKVELRPIYLTSMSEMLRGHVPGSIDLDIRYKDEFGEYREQYSVLTTIFDDLTFE